MKGRRSSRPVILLALILVLMASILIHRDSSHSGLFEYASAQPLPLYPVSVIISTTSEEVLFAAHSSNLAEGNWIELSDGVPLQIPEPLTLSYDGVDTATYIRGVETIAVESSFTQGQVTYPLNTHPVYFLGDPVDATFHGDTGFATQWVDFRLLKLTTFTELRDILFETFKGNLAPLKGKLSSPVWSQTVQLDAGGDYTHSFTAPNPGDYLLVVIEETAGPPYELRVYSATPVEVLDYSCDVSAPSSLTVGKSLYVNMDLDAGPSGIGYIYGAVLIKESAYLAQVQGVSNGNLPSSSLSVNGVSMVDGTLASQLVSGIEDLSYFTTALLTNKIVPAVGSNKVSIGFTTTPQDTAQTSLSTSGLSTGSYLLLVGVWEGWGQRLVALTQTTVTLKPRPLSPVAPSPPTSEDIEGMTPEEAAEFLAELSASSAAGILEEVAVGVAADILEEMEASTAAEIIERMSVGTAADIIQELAEEDAVDILVEVEVSVAAAVVEALPEEEAGALIDAAVRLGQAEEFSDIMLEMEEDAAAWALLSSGIEAGSQIVETMAGKDLNSTARMVDAAIKLAEQEADPEAAEELLRRLADMLGAVSGETLVELLIEISEPPEKPQTVAEVFEAMDPAKVGEVVSLWISTGMLEELGEVFGYLSPETLGGIYLGLSTDERAAIHSFLAEETIVILPPLPEFVVSQISVTPAQVETGEAITVSVQVSNVGAGSGDHQVVLDVDGAVENAESLSLGAGETATVTFQVVKNVAGDYTVEVDGLTESFQVVSPPAPAEFEASVLIISPETVEAGEPVTVSVTASNVGEESGSYTLMVEVDGEEVATQPVTLDGGESIIVSFTVSAEEDGSHTVRVNGLLGSFTVVTSPPAFPIIWIAALALILVSVILYLYWRSRSR